MQFPSKSILTLPRHCDTDAGACGSTRTAISTIQTTTADPLTSPMKILLPKKSKAARVLSHFFESTKRRWRWFRRRLWCWACSSCCTLASPLRTVSRRPCRAIEPSCSPALRSDWWLLLGCWLVHWSCIWLVNGLVVCGCGVMSRGRAQSRRSPRQRATSTDKSWSRLSMYARVLFKSRLSGECTMLGYWFIGTVCVALSETGDCGDDCWVHAHDAGRRLEYKAAESEAELGSSNKVGWFAPAELCRLENAQRKPSSSSCFCFFVCLCADPTLCYVRAFFFIDRSWDETISGYDFMQFNHRAVSIENKYHLYSKPAHWKGPLQFGG